MPQTNLPIAFQGAPGAYSDLACRTVFPGRATLPCSAFEDAFAAVHEGKAALAMIPIENSVAGRVADIHHLLPQGGLHIVGEHYQRVNHQLLAVPGASLDSLRTVTSHIQALSQCRSTLRRLGLTPITHADTAGAAAEVAARGDRSQGAIASTLAGTVYGLETLQANIEDHDHNQTRFVLLGAGIPAPTGHDRTSIVCFQRSDRPGSLLAILQEFAARYSEAGGSDPITLAVQEIPGDVPTEFRLSQNYPNPFKEVTHIRYKLTRSVNRVRIMIYDLAGSFVRELSGDTSGASISAEYNDVEWDGKNAAGYAVVNGVYTYKIMVEGNNETVRGNGKMFKLK